MAGRRLIVLEGTILTTGVVCIVAVVGGLDPKAGSSSVLHVQIGIRTLEWEDLRVAAIVVSLSQSLCAVAVSRAQRRICESANIHAVGGLTTRAHSGDARWQCAPLSHATRVKGQRICDRRKVRQCSAVCTRLQQDRTRSRVRGKEVGVPWSSQPHAT